MLSFSNDFDRSGNFVQILSNNSVNFFLRSERANSIHLKSESQTILKVKKRIYFVLSKIFSMIVSILFFFYQNLITFREAKKERKKILFQHRHIINQGRISYST